MELNGVLATPPLTVGEDYTFSVDLARYSYAVSTSAGTLIDTELRNALERKEKTITLYVRPYVVGSALVWGEKVRPGYALTVSVETLKKPSPEQFAGDVSKWNAYLDGRKSIGELSKDFSAAGLRLPVIASKAGCGQVALSIWDGTGLRPLDHVVYSVPVGKRDACGPAGDSVNAGFSTVLETAPSEARPASRPDAGLLVFDLARPIGEVRGVGLLVDATPLAEKEPKPPVVHAWPLFESVATYVTDPGNLLTLINSGRKKRTYAVAATELRTVMFPPGKNDDGTDGPGEVAFQALQRIARTAKHDPVVVARVTSSDRHAVYAPLSLLSTSGGPLGGRPIRVVHPAPFPPSSRQACVAAWTFVVPSSLKDYQGDVVAEPDSSWISSSRQATVDNLRAYFGKQSIAKPGAAEGLLLLAHQSKGTLWFDKEDERLRFSDLTRRFAPGSVAVLSACSVAAADGDNEAWLGRLSSQGVSGIFASPFPVDLEYGVELTRSFIRAVRKAQLLPKTTEAPTIASLFVDASEAAAKELKISPLDVQREFVWIGDPDIRLCK